MIMRGFFYILLGCLCSLSAQELKLNEYDAIVAVVNDKVITRYDVIRFSATQENYIRSKYYDSADPHMEEAMEEELLLFRNRVVTRMINNELMYAEFEKANLVIPEEYIQQNINRDMARISKGNVDQFNDYLQTKLGMTMKEYRQQLGRKIAVDYYINQQINDKIKIGPEETVAYYKNNTKRFTRPNMYRLQLLQYNPRKSSAEEEEAKVAEIKQAIADGEDFGQLSKKYSDPQFAKTEGLLPWRQEKQLSEDFKEQVKDLNPGGISEAVKIAGSWFWVKLVDKKEAGLITYEKVEKHIKDLLKRPKRENRIDYLNRQLRRTNFVRLYIYGIKR